jgi:hypothetical protein
MRWQRWNWLDHGLLPLLLALVRFGWLWPWLHLGRLLLLPNQTGELLDPGWLIGVPLLSLSLAHLAPVIDLPPERPNAMSRVLMPWWVRLGSAVVGVLVIALALWWQLYRADFVVWDGAWLDALGQRLIDWESPALPALILEIGALIYLWLRGMLDAAQPMSHDDVWGVVVMGVVALVLYLLAAALLGVGLLGNIGNLVVLLFAAGMTALAFSSLKTTVGLDYALGSGQRRAIKAVQTTRYWLISVVVVVGGLIGLGLLVVLVIAPEQVGRLVALVSTAIGLVLRLIGLVLIAISYVLFVLSYYIVQLLMPLLQRLMQLLQDLQLIEPPQRPEPTPTSALEQLTSEAIPDAYRWLALALVVLAVLVIFALVLRRMRALQSEEIDEVRESILSAGLLQEQLAALWRKLFGRPQPSQPFLALDGEPESRRRIRAAYQQLLARAGAIGWARLRAQTPVEYGQQLTIQVAETTAPLTTLTQRYNQARYAPDLPSFSETESAQQAWAQVQTQLVDNPQEETA